MPQVELEVREMRPRTTSFQKTSFWGWQPVKMMSATALHLMHIFGFKQDAAAKVFVRASMPGGRRQLRQEGPQDTVQVLSQDLHPMMEPAIRAKSSCILWPCVFWQEVYRMHA